MRAGFFLVTILIILGAGFANAKAILSSDKHMVLISEGTYLPFFMNSVSKDPKIKEPVLRVPVKVESFWMDRFPVTRGEYLRFVTSLPKWRKSKVSSLLADSHYLDDWKSDLLMSGSSSRSPITHISWFAAHAYCESLGKELPTTDQWEYVAGDRGINAEKAKAELLAWYSKPNPKRLPAVGSTPQNGFGVHDLIGLVWEWTLDFNSATVSEESREGATLDNNLFCGNGSQGALDSTDYASFMRFAFRNSLKANYTTQNLGFRCVKEIRP